jgi:DNA-binding MarR family transcriptional regulator
LEGNAQRSLIFEVFKEIGIVAQLSTAEFNRRMPAEIHVAHFGVISHLFWRGDGRTPGEIAKSFQVTKATMTHTLATLSAKGYIKISDHPTDGRSKLVYLTDQGRSFQSEAVATLNPVLDQLAGALTPALFQQLLPQLIKVREFLDENRSS